jgi:hypothetical protein
MKLHANFLTFAFAMLVLTGGTPQILLGQEEEKKPESARKLSELTLTDLLNMQVVTASKKVENYADAPGIVSTITAEEIKYFGAN